MIDENAAPLDNGPYSLARYLFLLRGILGSNRTSRQPVKLAEALQMPVAERLGSSLMIGIIKKATDAGRNAFWLQKKTGAI
ncbi:MAG TPA: hypothetical protein VGE06_04845, partial [Flavisolibacter sp.]